jgi:F-type H+-transporting ATPase subunit delta
VQLTADEIAALKSKLDKLTGKNVRVTDEVDPSLIGGVLVRIGDRVLDGTVKGHLEALREELVGRVGPGVGES